MQSTTYNVIIIFMSSIHLKMATVITLYNYGDLNLLIQLVPNSVKHEQN